MTLLAIAPAMPDSVRDMLKARDWPALERLLAGGFPPNASWPRPGSLFEYFVMAASFPYPPIPGTTPHRQQMRVVQAFLQAGLAPRPALGEQTSALPLSAAVLAGRPDFVRCLLGAAHSPGGLGPLHQAPLAMAAQRLGARAGTAVPLARTRACVEEIVAAGGDVNQPAPGGWLPLTLSAAAADRDMVALWLELGALPDARASGFPRQPGPRYSAAAWAIEHNHAPMLRLLLDAGASLATPYRPGMDLVEGAGTCAGPDAWQAIVANLGLHHRRVRRGWFQCLARDKAPSIHWFLCAGMSATEPGEHGWRPLDVATQHQAFAAIALLVAAGASAHAPAQDDLTPLARLRATGGSAALVRAGWGGARLAAARDAAGG